MSYSGPSGRGVNNASHAPQNTRALVFLSANPSTSVVLPIPASPLTGTMHPLHAATASSMPSKDNSESSPLREFAPSKICVTFLDFSSLQAGSGPEPVSIRALRPAGEYRGGISIDAHSLPHPENQ